VAHIAIFCDGTWNGPTIALPTHVHRLYSACATSAEQHPYYFAGVGSDGDMRTRIGGFLNKYGGGVFGWGLNRNLSDAYVALCKVYKPGDKILIFGFSRGAYTARSLAGMIRKCGILAEPTAANARKAFRLYRKKGPFNAPDKPHIWKVRRELSPKYATSAFDVIERLKVGDTGENDPFLVRISYLGIWDTVGALGLPQTLLGPIAALWNRRYLFHDTQLSSLVESARHAVALDERRVFYKPALWNNLEASRDDEGLNRGDRSPTRPYQQVWFVGDHGIVGGSAQAQGLTEITLDWIWQGAAATGLRLKPETPVPFHAFDPTMDAPEINDPSRIYQIARALLQWRDGPGHDIDLHDSARVRVQKVESYRPGSLRALLRDLFG
jgi:uncharacterized protein (DUF2235 family)